MNILGELKQRFQKALATLVEDPSDLLDMIRPAQDARFGDYQANCAMPLGKRMQSSPREIAAKIVEALSIDDLCEPAEIAGPGFVNLRLKDEVVCRGADQALTDERLGVTPVAHAKTYVVDYSSPNVAKPMHVGHIRSTVIGDALTRTLRFLGHHVTSDNHLGDWGTQFGMIIYGFKNFADRAAYEQQPVGELSRLYKLVNQLVEYHASKAALPDLRAKRAERSAAVEKQESSPVPEDKPAQKKAAKLLRQLRTQQAEAAEQVETIQNKIAKVDGDTELAQRAAEHPGIGQAVLAETAKLHSGDEENNRLWGEFLPHCRRDIQRVYDRLDVKFDHEHGESFYNGLLADVVSDLQVNGMASESEGAMCVFMDGFTTPMIIQKKDGAFLYATTDLATIKYRVETWNPDVILYIVDHRQSEHFDKLFAAAHQWKYDSLELRHISFGTVLGNDGKPYKTRSGDTVGLESLLDEAVSRALKVVSENDDRKPSGAELSQQRRDEVAAVVGHGAIKYADLSQNRTSDYVFSYDKMLALTGNTATYMQYSYARVRSIFRKGNVDIDALRDSGIEIQLTEPAERSLALAILRFGESLDLVVDDYRPNQLTTYLFELSKHFSVFFEKCPVLKADDEDTKNSRLLLCDLTSRVIKQGLQLLGISVVEQM